MFTNKARVQLAYQLGEPCHHVNRPRSEETNEGVDGVALLSRGTSCKTDQSCNFYDRLMTRRSAMCYVENDATTAASK